MTIPEVDDAGALSEQAPILKGSRVPAKRLSLYRPARPIHSLGQPQPAQCGEPTLDSRPVLVERVLPDMPQ